MAVPGVPSSFRPEVVHADFDTAALLAKMGNRVADDGFYIPSPMLPPQRQGPGQVFSFDFQPTNFGNPPHTTPRQGYAAPQTGGYHHHPFQRPYPMATYACEGFAPSTPRSQQRAVADHVYAKHCVTPKYQAGNYFQFPEPIGEMVFKQSPKTPTRREAIPYPVPSKDHMTPPSALLKEEPVDPRYSCDVITPESSRQSMQQVSSNAESGYFSSFQDSPGDAISPTESEASLASVEDILRSCLVVLGDCDIGMADCNVGQQGVAASCEAILSPEVIPSDVTSSVKCDVMAPLVFHDFSAVEPRHANSTRTTVPMESLDTNIPYLHNTSRVMDIVPQAAGFPMSSTPNGQENLVPFKLEPVPTKAARKARQRASDPIVVKPILCAPRHPRTKHKALHMCQYCERAFTSISGLRQHENTHTGARPFKCDFCPQAFAQRSTLRTHRRSIHTKERPYSCKHCDRRFSDYSTHVKHERTHTGVRPYKCRICGRAFSQSGNLYRHEATKHTPEELAVVNAIEVTAGELFRAMQN